MYYNHKSIKLTQRSVQQAIDLQLFEKRMELYNALADDRAFIVAPLSLKIAYSEEVYQLYSDIVELCEKRWEKICDFAVAIGYKGYEGYEHGNVCHELYRTYTQLIEEQIQISKEREALGCNGIIKTQTLEKHKESTDSLHAAICEKISLLERNMKMILEQSITILK